MKSFACACGARVFFDNTSCLACQRELGFFPGARKLAALEPVSEGIFSVAGEDALPHRKCENYSGLGVCNWMTPLSDDQPLCLACRLTEVIPDLSEAANRQNWAKMEAAKRRLVYSLLRLGLPVVPKRSDPERGLAFEIKGDLGDEHVVTGHENGRITLNIAEADPVLREKMRVSMNERYRTLLGHFRHEIGHYYWDCLLQASPLLERFRELFGDERRDYGEALEQYYAAAERTDWLGEFVSAYATAHPWEDWAESFAHYLHIVDTLETAESFGMRLSGDRRKPGDFARLMSDFVELSLVMNALNRSMGLDDAYPFQLGAGANRKLEFVHELVTTQKRSA